MVLRGLPGGGVGCVSAVNLHLLGCDRGLLLCETCSSEERELCCWTRMVSTRCTGSTQVRSPAPRECSSPVVAWDKQGCGTSVQDRDGEGEHGLL